MSHSNKVLIIGSHGVGKTTLVEYFKRSDSHLSNLSLTSVNHSDGSIALSTPTPSSTAVHLQNEHSVSKRHLKTYTSEMSETNEGGLNITAIQLPNQERLDLWDCKGHAKFCTLSTSLYSQASAILILFDSTSSKSFKDVALWLKDVRRCSHPSTFICIVANKIDLHRVVTFEIAKKFAVDNSLPIFECSALIGTNVRSLLLFLVTSIHEAHRGGHKRGNIRKSPSFRGQSKSIEMTPPRIIKLGEEEFKVGSVSSSCFGMVFDLITLPTRVFFSGNQKESSSARYLSKSKQSLPSIEEDPPDFPSEGLAGLLGNQASRYRYSGTPSRDIVLNGSVSSPGNDSNYNGNNDESNNGELEEIKFCTLGCGKFIEAREMENHINNDCFMRHVKCNYCFEQVAQFELENHQVESCVMRIVSCSLGCGQTMVEKCRQDHENAYMTLPIKKWTPYDVVHFVSKNIEPGAADLQAFLRHKVDGPSLKELTNDDLLNDLGMPSGIERRRLLKAISQFEDISASTSSSSSSNEYFEFESGIFSPFRSATNTPADFLNGMREGNISQNFFRKSTGNYNTLSTLHGTSPLGRTSSSSSSVGFFFMGNPFPPLMKQTNHFAEAVGEVDDADSITRAENIKETMNTSTMMRDVWGNLQDANIGEDLTKKPSMLMQSPLGVYPRTLTRKNTDLRPRMSDDFENRARQLSAYSVQSGLFGLGSEDDPNEEIDQFGAGSFNFSGFSTSLSQEVRVPISNGRIVSVKVINFEDLILEPKKLGSGSFGSVFRGKYRDADIAAKKLFTQQLNEVDLLREAAVMTSACNHPNILHFFGVSLTPPNICFVSELLKVSLEDHLRFDKNNTSEPLSEIVRFAAEAASGLLHLHAEGVVHRDIAARNLLLTNSYPPTVKVCDFGLARVLDSQQSDSGSINLSGPLRWMAPESLRPVAGLTRFSYASDVYMFGITIW